VQRSQTRFLTTHTGSLIRPDTVAGKASPDADAGLRADTARALTAAVADVVTRQRAVGLDVVNDGEFGKSSWSAYVL
jgi:5-methyltetrahydropteroyltriglutamate--homocysteine methyltransferase